MQNLQHPYEEIFGEIKILLTELADSDSYENLLNKENQLNQLYQKFSFLKISNEFGYSSTINEALEVIENQETNLDSDLISVEEFENEYKVAEIIVAETEVHDIFDDVPEVEEVHSFKEIDEKEHSQENVVEEVSNFAEIESKENEVEEQIESEQTGVFEDESVEEISNFAEIISEENKIEEGIHSKEHQVLENEPINEVSSFAEIDSEENQVEEKIKSEENGFISEIEENLLQDSSQKLEPMQDSQFSFAMNREEVQAPKEDDYEARLAEKEAKLRELEENRRKILELSKNAISQEKPLVVKDSQQDDHADKKFKLANIKGLKIAKSLFDDDHLEEVEQHQPKQDSGSLLKNNVPTDYMEAPKPKPEFKLDLNDRIAFSQHLFDGSQSELNQVVTVLNSFTSLDKAQEFLSDIYYERDWKKVDSYAQRLWTLVENRFL